MSWPVWPPWRDPGWRKVSTSEKLFGITSVIPTLRREVRLSSSTVALVTVGSNYPATLPAAATAVVATETAELGCQRTAPSLSPSFELSHRPCITGRAQNETHNSHITNRFSTQLAGGTLRSVASYLLPRARDRVRST